ncbi:MAG: B12-binding domain-containing radical SAM protein, partial [Ilumatobacteraceae bacterium]
MPIGLAYLASTLRRDRAVDVLDVFGEAPTTARRDGDFVFLGLSDAEVLAHLDRSDPEVIVVYANQVANHEAILHLIRLARARFASVPILVIENTQAVTAYSVAELEGEFLTAGASSVIDGEPETKITSFLGSGSASVAPIEVTKRGQIADLDSLDFPAWDLLPVANYWGLGFGHGPVSSDRYLPILTSRGCPYPCKFCVVPKTNERRWRARSAINVVDEMEFMVRTFGVTEFHLEDLNPTIKD